MTHPPSGPSTPTPPAGPRSGVLLALDVAVSGVIATATRRLPEPAGPAEEIGQAELMLRLQMARAAIARLLHPQTPARRDPISAAVGADAIATPGGPVTTRWPSC